MTFVAMGLGGMGRAQVVGTRMMGLGAGITRVELPHCKVTVEISAEPVYQLDGAPRSAFRPNLEVDLAGAPAEVEDPLLEHALRQLEESIGAPRGTTLKTGPRSSKLKEESAAPPPCRST